MIRSLLVLGMMMSAVALADDMNQSSILARRAKELPKTLVIKVDRKNKNKIEVAHVYETLKPGEKPQNLAFAKMGLSDEQVGIANVSSDDMESFGGTPSWRGGFARPGIGRPGIGGVGLGRGGYGYGRGYIRGAARGAYWGARAGYGAGLYSGSYYGNTYYGGDGYYDSGYGDSGYGASYPTGYYDASLYPGGNVDPSFWATSAWGGCASFGGCSSWGSWSGCGSWCGGAWTQPFYNYYGTIFPYRPYWGWQSASSIYIYCQPGGWWG